MAHYGNFLADRDFGLNYEGCYYTAVTPDGDERVVVCSGSEDRLVARDNSCREQIDAEFVNAKWPKLGLRNNSGNRCAMHVSRRPARQYRRGPKPSNTVCEAIAERGLMHMGGGQPAFENGAYDFFNPTFPSYAFAQYLMRTGWQSVALNCDIALTANGKVYYQRWYVADLNEGVLTFKGEQRPRIRRAVKKAVSYSRIGE